MAKFPARDRPAQGYNSHGRRKVRIRAKLRVVGSL